MGKYGRATINNCHSIRAEYSSLRRPKGAGLLHPNIYYSDRAIGEGGGGGERGGGVPIHMPMIRLETAENHRMYCVMPSDKFIPGLRQESNLQPLGYRSTVLATELLRP